MIYLLSYDLSDLKLRSKLSKMLIKSGFKRVQKSVYLGELSVAKLSSIKTNVGILLNDYRETSMHIIMIPVREDNMNDVEHFNTFEFDLEFILSREKFLYF